MLLPPDGWFAMEDDDDDGKDCEAAEDGPLRLLVLELTPPPPPPPPVGKDNREYTLTEIVVLGYFWCFITSTMTVVRIANATTDTLS